MPRCPGCFVPLTISNYGGVNVKTCASCFGTWISRLSLMHLVRMSDPPQSGADQPSLKDLAALVIEGHCHRPMPCPECRRQMTIARLHPLIPVDMQFCSKCGYVWLDVGKLAMTLRLYQELLRSSDPRIIEMRDRYALASFGMETPKDRDPVPQQHVARGAGETFSDIYGPGGYDLNSLVQILGA